MKMVLATHEVNGVSNFFLTKNIVILFSLGCNILNRSVSQCFTKFT